MSEGLKVCARQEACPLLLGALHAKVTAEAEMRLAKGEAGELRDALEASSAKFAGKRRLMNDLYKAAKRCREAQRKYFSAKSQDALVAARTAEKDLDGIIATCARSRTPATPELPGMEGGAK